jgi:hypothetical protein
VSVWALEVAARQRHRYVAAQQIRRSTHSRKGEAMFGNWLKTAILMAGIVALFGFGGLA